MPSSDSTGEKDPDARRMMEPLASPPLRAPRRSDWIRRCKSVVRTGRGEFLQEEWFLEVGEPVKVLQDWTGAGSYMRRLCATSPPCRGSPRKQSAILSRRPQVARVFRSLRMDGCYLRVETVSGFAGDLLTQRSTMGIALIFGAHLLKASSHLQSTGSLSSCEAE